MPQHDRGRILAYDARSDALHLTDDPIDLTDAMAVPFPADRFDAAVMALVLVFVPEPARGIEEMVRVVRPGGSVAAYMWDMLGGGFPLDPILVEMHAMGFTPPRPPRLDASRREMLHDLWTGAGIGAVETREITVRRTFMGFDDFWMTNLKSPSIRRHSRRDDVWRRRRAQEPGACAATHRP